VFEVSAEGVRVDCFRCAHCSDRRVYQGIGGRKILHYAWEYRRTASHSEDIVELITSAVDIKARMRSFSGLQPRDSRTRIHRRTAEQVTNSLCRAA